MTRHLDPRATVVLPMVVLLLIGSGVRGQDADPAATLVARAGRYVREYEQRFSGMVGEEHQTQRLVKAAGTTTKQRDLISDILFVKAGDLTLVFRDVSIVDGKPVRNRQERLQQLFLGTPRGAVKQAQAIVAEGARYDIPFPRFRVLSGLMLPLVIVKPGTSERFRFASTDDGVTLDEVRYPTLFRYYRMRSAAVDMPLHGRLSIDAASGELRSASLVAVNAESEGSVEVRYVNDAKIGLLVPAQMRERYRRPAKPKDDHLEVSSDYSNFRRFEVTIEEQVEMPK